MERYMILDIDKTSIFLKEQVMGVTIESVKLNSITRSTYLQFFQFYNERYRSMPIVVKNEPKYITIMKEFVGGRDPVKAEITKVTSDYLCIDMSSRVDNLGMRTGDGVTVIHDLRIILG